MEDLEQGSSNVFDCCVLIIFKTCVLISTKNESFLAQKPTFQIKEGDMLKVKKKNDHFGKLITAVLFKDHNNV